MNLRRWANFHWLPLHFGLCWTQHTTQPNNSVPYPFISRSSYSTKQYDLIHKRMGWCARLCHGHSGSHGNAARWWEEVKESAKSGFCRAVVWCWACVHLVIGLVCELGLRLSGRPGYKFQPRVTELASKKNELNQLLRSFPKSIFFLLCLAPFSLLFFLLRLKSTLLRPISIPLAYHGPWGHDNWYQIQSIRETCGTNSEPLWLQAVKFQWLVSRGRVRRCNCGARPPSPPVIPFGVGSTWGETKPPPLPPQPPPPRPPLRQLSHQDTTGLMGPRPIGPLPASTSAPDPFITFPAPTSGDLCSRFPVTYQCWIRRLWSEWW